MKHLIAILLAITCAALSPIAKAVIPAPDGGYPGANTAEGQNALLSLTSGTFNSAVGFLALRSNTEGNFNTAIGAGSLFASVGDENTATGAGALLSNTIGEVNTAIGAFALVSNTEGNNNTATGVNALHDNTTGINNTANGRNALFSNNTTSHNTAIGFDALGFNTGGSNNTAVGENALEKNITGSGNTALGAGAGINVLSANNVICVGHPGHNVDNSCYIGNIFGQTVSGGTAVFVDSSGRLGSSTSSRRFKRDIEPMQRASEALFALNPVVFRYKTEIDPQGLLQFGLVAEDVEAVKPDLVVRDHEGKAKSVRYEAVNMMLLNEFLKEHRKNEQQEKTITQLQASAAKEQSIVAQQQEEIKVLAGQLKEQAAQIEKVNAQFQLNTNSLQNVSE